MSTKSFIISLPIITGDQDRRRLRKSFSFGSLMKAFRLLSAALLVPLGAALAAPSATIEPEAPLRSEARTVVRIGLLDFESEASYLSRRENIQETIVRHLQENSPGLRIVPRFYTTEALSEAVRKGEVEFFLGSSGFFVQMRPMGARDIGTITSRAFPDPNRCVAGVIVVRSGRADITDLARLEGMTAVTTSRANFMTYMLNMGEIAAAGFRPDKFFSAVTETDNRPVEVLRAVVEGRADAGLLRACMPEAITERHPEFAGRWTVVNDKPGLRAEALGCRYSTDMYPGWTIASVPHTPPVITKHVAMLLLNLKPDMTPGGFTVSIATEFDRVNDLFRSLKTGPFAYLNHWTLERIWDEARGGVLLLLGFLAAWILHFARLEKLVRRRTADLSAALEREKAAREQVRETGARLDSLQRAGIVGQLSSMFAHELCQPLSAVRCYLRGMRTLMRRGAPDPVLAERCLSGMSAELDKAGAIIDRVRSYAREGARRDLPVDLPALLSECLADMTKSDRLKVPVAADIRPGLIVSGDAVELRVLVINLVKNAQEAILSAPEPAQASGGRPYGLFITLDAADEGTAVRLTVANTGALLTPEALAEIGRPLASSKSSGLGLGLMICKSIAEAHLATLAFSARTARDGGGLAVTLTMPARSEAPLHENYGNLP